MPRSYGITNVAPWASAPPVGPAGDTYYNTGNKALYISDGTTWNQIQAGGGGGGAPYAPVTGTPPNPSSPTVTPPTGLLWVDTSTTPSWTPVAGPTGPTGPTGAQGPLGPGLVDYGVTAADLNTLTASGTYVAADTNSNAPPFPAGQYVLIVSRVSAGSFMQQQATHIAQPNFIANRMYTSGAWQGWKSPAAGQLWTGTGPSTAFSGGVGTLWSPAPGVQEIAGRKYRVSIWWALANNTGASQAFVYYTLGNGNWTPPANSRIFWQGATTTAGQSNYIATSWVYTANSTMVPVWTLGFNAAGGTPWAIGANGLTMVLEDVGY